MLFGPMNTRRTLIGESLSERSSGPIKKPDREALIEEKKKEKMIQKNSSQSHRRKTNLFPRAPPAASFFD